MSAPFGRQSGKPAAGDGLTLAIEFVSKRRDDYVSEYGFYDHTTGVTEFPGTGDETVADWQEIIEGLEALRSQQAMPSQALQDIAAERQRQQEAEGWTAAHDDRHINGELAAAAGTYALVASGRFTDVARQFWPWDFQWWKPHSQRRNLVKAGALIAADIERIDRAEAKSTAL